MIKRITPQKQKININKLSEQELKDLVVQIASKLNLDVIQKD